jgi:ornithine cyclodeaminase
MVGGGALAPFLVRAHASVRQIREAKVWNRSRPGAERVVAELVRHGIATAVADDLASAAAEADIISTATLSAEPLIRGAWLKPGTHVDCVGAFKPGMRETDDDVARRARIYVDTRAGAFAEAGDILQPLRAGVIGKEAVLGELAELCRGTVKGRTSPEEITLFKSVGASIEDLAAAVAVYERLARLEDLPPG